MHEERATTENVWEAMRTQRAIRRFRPDPVPDELIMRIVEAGTRAPSSANRQPWRFVVVTDPAIRQRIAAAIRDRNANDPVAQAQLANPETLPPDRRRMRLRTAALVDQLEHVPVLIVPCLHWESGEGPKLPGLFEGDSIYPAVQNMLLAARSLGLGSLMTGWQKNVPSLVTILDLPEGAVPVTVLPIGWPAEDFGPTRRKPTTEVTFWNRWGQAPPAGSA